MEEFFRNIIDKRLILSISVVLITLNIYLITKKIISVRIKGIDSKESDKNLRKRKTYLKVLRSSMKYLYIVLDIIILLQIYGINVSSIIAGLGIVSIITGLALQDALKDFIAGFNIIVDNYFSVGDVIKIDEVIGKVTDVQLKVTKLKDINTENVLVIANRNIVKALTISKQLDIDVPIPFGEKTDKIEKIMEEMVVEISDNKNIQEVKYMGIQEFGESAILYKIRIWCFPEFKPEVKRAALGIIKRKLDSKKIEIPYKQIDIHQK